MISRIYIILALFAEITSLHADGEKLARLQVGTETYTNVIITSVSASEIYFTHSRGLGNAKLKNLSPSLQKMFRFDPANAEAQQAEQAKANALYNQSVKNVTRPRPVSPKPEIEQVPQPGTANGIAPHPIKAKAFLNQPAPTLQVEKWLTDPPQAAGKFVLLDFWATWCGPCRESIPELNQLQERFKDRLVVIGLSDEREQRVRAMQTPRIEYAVAIDTQRRVLTQVEVKAIPHSILIDPSGVVRFEGHPRYLNEKNLEVLLTRFAK